jgi:hypothetical protein
LTDTHRGAQRQFAFLCNALDVLDDALDTVKVSAVLSRQLAQDLAILRPYKSAQMLRSKPDILANVVLVAHHPNLLGYATRAPPLEALSPEVCLPRCLGYLDLPGLFAAAAPVVLEHEGHLVTLVERPDSCRFERGCMDEHVLAVALLLDEAEAFCSV